MDMDQLVTDFLSRMGLALPVAILEKQDKGSKSKSRKVRIQLTLDSSLKGLQRLIQLRGMVRIVKRKTGLGWKAGKALLPLWLFRSFP